MEESPKFVCAACGECVYAALNRNKEQKCSGCIQKKNAEYRSRMMPPTQIKNGWRNRKWRQTT